MVTAARKRGVTRVEVLALSATGALLLLLAGPVALHKPPPLHRPHQAVCLSNLRQISQALQAYAAEDAHELIVPIHMNMVRSVPFWLWSRADFYAWGRRFG